MPSVNNIKVVKKHVIEITVSGNSNGGTAKETHLMNAIQAHNEVYSQSYVYTVVIKLVGDEDKVKKNANYTKTAYAKAAKNLTGFMFSLFNRPMLVKTYVEHEYEDSKQIKLFC